MKKNKVLKFKTIENPIRDKDLIGLEFEEYFEFLNIKSEKGFSIGCIQIVSKDIEKRDDLNITQKELLREFINIDIDFKLSVLGENVFGMQEKLRENFNKALLEENQDFEELLAKNIDNKDFIKQLKEDDNNKIYNLLSNSFGFGKIEDLLEIVRKNQMNPDLREAKERSSYKKKAEAGRTLVLQNLKSNFKKRKHLSREDEFINNEINTIKGFLNGDRKTHPVLKSIRITKKKDKQDMVNLYSLLLCGNPATLNSNNFVIYCKLLGIVDYKNWLKNNQYLSNEESIKNSFITLRDKVRKLVAQNNLSEAINSLIKFYEKNEMEEKLNEIIAISSSYKVLEKMRTSDIIGHENQNIDRNRITTQILNSLTQIE